MSLRERKISTNSDRYDWHPYCDGSSTLSIIVAGASGDLARKKTFPSLAFLFMNGFLPVRTQVIGYGRTPITMDEFRERLRPTLPGDEEQKLNFLRHCSYVDGSYDGPEGFQKLHELLRKIEMINPQCPVGRLFYLALPPSIYPMVSKMVKEYCDLDPMVNPRSWLRLVVEKPFGRDVESSEELAEQLGCMWPENQLYRIDHYLGKEMLQSLFVMRFANALLAPIWSREHVANVQITFKEDFGTEGRGGYFDHYGIIRDMIATHLSQILAFVAMEKPASQHPDDIRDEKLKLLRAVKPASSQYCVLGQYNGYRDDPTVSPGSNTPTFAQLALFIENDRWAGVPFFIKAGKGLNERKAEVRVQLHETPCFIFEGDAKDFRNEIVFRLQPDEAAYVKLLVKNPGLEMGAEVSEMELDYKTRYPGVVIPDAYSRLILEALRGDQQHFLRRDELRAAWAIFDTLLHEIDDGEVPVHEYERGTRGPSQSDELLASLGYRRPVAYQWVKRNIQNQ